MDAHNRPHLAALCGDPCVAELAGASAFTDPFGPRPHLPIDVGHPCIAAEANDLYRAPLTNEEWVNGARYHSLFRAPPPANPVRNTKRPNDWKSQSFGRLVLVPVIATVAPLRSHAASQSSAQITVGATVLAGCSINIAALRARPEAALAAGRTICARTQPTSATVAPSPTMRMTRDAQTGLSMLIIVF